MVSRRLVRKGFIPILRNVFGRYRILNDVRKRLGLLSLNHTVTDYVRVKKAGMHGHARQLAS